MPGDPGATHSAVPTDGGDDGCVRGSEHGLGCFVLEGARLPDIPYRRTAVNQIVSVLDIDQKFVLEVASGIKEPALLAEEYGYTPEQWLFLKEYEPFKKQVEAKKTELKANGYTFRMKAAIAAEDLLDSVYLKAKEQGASFHTQLEAVKFMARAAGLETPPKAEVSTGPAFSITINLGSGRTVQIGGETQTASAEVVDVDVVDFDTTSAFPEYTPQPLR